MYGHLVMAIFILKYSEHSENYSEHDSVPLEQHFILAGSGGFVNV